MTALLQWLRAQGPAARRTVQLRDSSHELFVHSRISPSWTFDACVESDGNGGGGREYDGKVVVEDTWGIRYGESDRSNLTEVTTSTIPYCWSCLIVYTCKWLMSMSVALSLWLVSIWHFPKVSDYTNGSAVVMTTCCQDISKSFHLSSEIIPVQHYTSWSGSSQTVSVDIAILAEA